MNREDRASLAATIAEKLFALLAKDGDYIPTSLYNSRSVYSASSSLLITNKQNLAIEINVSVDNIGE